MLPDTMTTQKPYLQKDKEGIINQKLLTQNITVAHEILHIHLYSSKEQRKQNYVHCRAYGL